MKKSLFKILAAILVISMLLVSVGCGENKEQSSQAQAETEISTEQDSLFTAGTYSSTADGHNGPIQISVTFDDISIVSIDIDSQAETEGIGTTAIEKITEEILSSQSLNIDAVSGATVTSNSILDAVKDCVLQADGDIEKLLAKSSNNAINEDVTVETDYLIIGAGGAGLTAAITALENGQEVTIIEKMSFPGGASILSEGYIAGGGSEYQASKGIEDNSEVIYNDLMVGGKNLNQTDLLKIYAENMGDTFNWLVNDIGITLTENSPLSFPEHTNDRVMVVDGGGAAYVSALVAKFESLGGELMLDTKAVELLLDNNSVTGVRAEKSDGTQVTINAAATLITTGGYGASEELRPEGLEDVVFYGATSSTGDGILLAEEIGAQTHMMEYMKIYPQGLLNPPDEKYTSDGALSRNGISSAIGCKQATDNTGAIYVNTSAKRFVNENIDFVSIKETQMEQPENKMFIVMDQKGYDAWYEYTSTVLTEEQADLWFSEDGKTEPIFIKSDSIEGLAEKANLDPTEFVNTISEFNSMVDAKEDTQFGRSNMDYKIEDGTYYLIELKLRTATTLGGLKTNESFQVLDNDNNPIDGLYAAGEVVGGANGSESLPSCMNAWAVTSARVASVSVLDYLSNK